MNIFNWFKRNPTYKDFTIMPDVLKNKKIICYGNLFLSLGMEDLVKKLCINGKYHYVNIRANKTTIDTLDKMLEEHLCKTKNKYSKMYKEKALLNMSAFDRLMYAPKEDTTIKDNIIRVLLPNHKEYTQPIKE